MKKKYEILANALNFILFNNLGEIHKDEGNQTVSHTYK